LNCAAIPRDLMESEIFGHAKGAFTGAIADREGAARRAHRGTLFLDEICELDPALQAKLLRFLQTGQISRIGGDVEDVDVRIICATNRNPTEEVRGGRFREDLYYRLHVIPIHLPALSERGDDVVEIATHFFRTYAEQEGRSFERLDETAQARLKQHPWPGNVRELQNVIRNTIVMHHAPVVDAAALAAIEADGASPRPAIGADRTRALDRLADEIRPLADVERQAIERALSLCDGDIRKASLFLEIAPATIYRKLKSWRSHAS
jgi:two-component system repressor protein LuxO